MELTVPKSVTTMNGSGSSSYYYSPFDGAMYLQTVVFEEGMTTIPAYALRYSGSLNPITSATIPDSVKTIGNDAFNGANGLASLYIPPSVQVLVIMLLQTLILIS